VISLLSRTRFVKPFQCLVHPHALFSTHVVARRSGRRAKESARPNVDFGFGVEDFFFRIPQLHFRSSPASPSDGRITALLFWPRRFCASAWLLALKMGMSRFMTPLPNPAGNGIKIKMGEKVLCHNKKAHFNYHVEETYEAGMALQGTEVKSLRLGKGNLKDSFVQIEEEEAFLHNTHISPYPYGHQFNHDPERVRKLLLHKREIRRLMGKTQERGYTLVPLKIYLKNGKIKIEIGLAKGKTLYDKREVLKKRSADREIEKVMKGNR
jgi:SsrA-binding protein